MKAEPTLRKVLFGAALAICVTTPIELWLTEHYQQPAQLIPLVMCGVSGAALAAAWLRPTQQTLQLLRGVMVLLAGAGFLGLYFHLAGNFAFELEIRPNATLNEVIVDALRGVNPLLAPGILCLAAVLGLAATYQHPDLA